MFGKLSEKFRPTNTGGHIPADVTAVIENISVYIRPSYDDETPVRVLIFGLCGGPINAEAKVIERRVTSAWPELSATHLKRVVNWLLAEANKRSATLEAIDRDKSKTWVHGWDNEQQGVFK